MKKILLPLLMLASRLTIAADFNPAGAQTNTSAVMTSNSVTTATGTLVAQSTTSTNGAPVFQVKNQAKSVIFKITQDGTVTPTAGSINGSALVNGSVDTTKIGSGAVDTTKINWAAVTTNAIANLAVDTSKIGSGAIDTTKLGYASVKTNTIADGSVTQAKFAASVSASKIVQVVYCHTEAVTTGSTIIPFDNSIPQITEGDQYLTCSITPSAAANNLFVQAMGYWGEETNAAAAITDALFRDSTADAIGVNFTVDDGANDPLANFFSFAGLPIQVQVPATSTALTTFQLRAGPNAGAGGIRMNGVNGARVFGGALSTSIVIYEQVP